MIENRFKETIIIDELKTEIKYRKVLVYDSEVITTIDEDGSTNEEREDLDINKLYLDISERKLDIANIKTISFDKDCTVPRNKVRDFCNKNNLKVVNDKSKADIIFISKKTLEDKFTYEYDYQIDKNILLDLLGKGKALFYGDISELINDIKVINYDKCFVFTYDIINLLFSINKLKNDFENFNSHRVYYIEQKDLTEYITNYDKYYSQEEILNLINTGTTITKEIYEQLRSLFGSSDKQNLAVAMEIMANSNYSESIVYLSLLLREYYYNEMRGTSLINHVNFKGLMRYLSLNRYRINLDDIIELCEKKDQLTRANVDILLELMLKETKDRSDTEKFIITKVELDPEVLSKVKEPNATSITVSIESIEFPDENTCVTNEINLDTVSDSTL